MELKELIEKTKHGFPILAVCDRLGIDLRSEQGGRYYRGDCPLCQEPRTFRVTPERNMYGCFACRDNNEKNCRGDQLQLVQTVKNLRNVKEACEWLWGRVGGIEEESVPKRETPFKPLELDSDHIDVELLGFDPEDARKIGIGFYADHGTVLVPIRLPDGALVGYLGVQDCSLPERWEFPTEKVVQLWQRNA
jgi:hypothetical protein